MEIRCSCDVHVESISTSCVVEIWWIPTPGRQNILIPNKKVHEALRTRHA
jgi:hypothetical protein